MSKRPARPRYLFIGPHKYRFRYHKGVLSNENIGEFSRNRGIIDIDKSVTFTQEQETLVHEGLGHGVIADIGHDFGGTEEEERFVLPFGTSMLDVLQDPRNRPFFRYVMWRQDDDE